jgi:transcriptional regulator with XRE-family HTH domain
VSQSPKQIRAAELLGRGLTQQEIADEVKVSRRTIIRWCQDPDFKNLAYGLRERSVPNLGSDSNPKISVSKLPGKVSRDRYPQELINLAIETVEEILLDPDSSAGYKLKAAQLAGEWGGLTKRKVSEIESVKILAEAGWLPDSVLNSVAIAWQDFQRSIEGSFTDENR